MPLACEAPESSKDMVGVVSSGGQRLQSVRDKAQKRETESDAIIIIMIIIKLVIILVISRVGDRADQKRPALVRRHVRRFDHSRERRKDMSGHIDRPADLSMGGWMGASSVLAPDASSALSCSGIASHHHAMARRIRLIGGALSVS